MLLQPVFYPMSHLLTLSSILRDPSLIVDRFMKHSDDCTVEKGNFYHVYLMPGLTVDS